MLQGGKNVHQLSKDLRFLFCLSKEANVTSCQVFKSSPTHVLNVVRKYSVNRPCFPWFLSTYLRNALSRYPYTYINFPMHFNPITLKNFFCLRRIGLGLSSNDSVLKEQMILLPYPTTSFTTTLTSFIDKSSMLLCLASLNISWRQLWSVAL